MYQYGLLLICMLITVWFARLGFSLRHNIALAEASGLPYAIFPVNGIAGYFWTAIQHPVRAIIKKIPYLLDRHWDILAETHRGWYYAQELVEIYGEAFLIVSPGQIYMNMSNPGGIMQITNRRNDFPKPIEIYAIIDIFGTSMLSSEGERWKRQRKIIAPAFSEKSNALVWDDSLKQGSSMLNYWASMSGNTDDLIRVGDTAIDTALMSLHVISAAGFGVKQTWENEGDSELGTDAIPGFNTTKLSSNHTLAFKDSLNILLRSVIWMAILPIWLMRLLPFDVFRILMRSYDECNDYFKELISYKNEQLLLDKKSDFGTMDLMGPLIKASEIIPTSKDDLYVTKQEVIANSWIFLFAGRESTANTIHHAFLFLAIARDTQSALQQDIDRILGTRKPDTWTYETDMGLLYNSLVGATMNETLRLMPPIIDMPKVVKYAPQTLQIDGKEVTIPLGTMMHLNSLSAHKNPRYWPHSPSKLSSKSNDLNDFVPQRWLSQGSYKRSPSPESNSIPNPKSRTPSPTPGQLFTPLKGSFIPFSEGARACPGKRFAQIEITAVLAVIFQTHSIELDVSAWASDREIEMMGTQERREVYEKAMARARRLMLESESIITLQMMEKVPVNFVRRGRERFGECYK